VGGQMDACMDGSKTWLKRQTCAKYSKLSKNYRNILHLALIKARIAAVIYSKFLILGDKIAETLELGKCFEYFK
jgi:hypothetical protein